MANFDFSLFRGDRASLATNIPIKNGQLIFSVDDQLLNVDSGSVRLSVASEKIVRVGEDGVIKKIGADDVYTKNDIADLANGGTGANNAEQARANLGVAAAADCITSQYQITLASANWFLNAETNKYVQNISLPELKCGSDGTNSPIVSVIENEEEYQLLDSTSSAERGVGLTFISNILPVNPIVLLVTDVM